MMLVILNQLGLSDEVVALPTPIKETKPVYLVFSKAGERIANKEEFVTQFGAVLEEMRQDGTFQNIYDTYVK